jgi:hypothetical protein
MAIYRLLHQAPFVADPELVHLMGRVYEDVVKAVGLDRGHPRSELIARKVFELTKAGERDPARLKDQAIQACQNSAHRSESGAAS